MEISVLWISGANFWTPELDHKAGNPTRGETMELIQPEPDSTASTAFNSPYPPISVDAGC